MLCDICKKNDAAIRFAEISRGRMTVRNICNACARATGIADQLEQTIASLGEAIGGALASMAGDHDTGIACPSCGMTLEQFRQHGHLGCERCYDTFAVVLLPLLEGLRQLGGKPAAAAAAADAGQHGDHRRQALEQRLREAVDAEEYELAARLRDQLKALAGAQQPAPGRCR